MTRVSKESHKKQWNWRSPSTYSVRTPKGLNTKVIKKISAIKQEPNWMLRFRLNAFTEFQKKTNPTWGTDLSKINFSNLYYYLKPEAKQTNKWSDLPIEIKQTYDYLGIPKAEQEWLGGVSAQYESEVLYKSIQKELAKQGVVFLDTDSALKQYPQLFKQYFGRLIPATDNKYAALNSAVWSGGSFVYVPPGVKVTMPLQAYFRINAQNVGQFERTLIIAEPESSVHYIEGCSAPVYSSASLHSAVVEIFVGEKAQVRYTTVQNWSPNVYNLVTKRSQIARKGSMQWIDGNLGSKATMKYPSCYLIGEGARGEVLSLAYASQDQHQDTGAKMYHLAPNTSSRVISKSVSRSGGRTSYRGFVYVQKGAQGSKTSVVCDALLLDPESRSDTYPTMKIKEKQTQAEHEAKVAKIGEEQIIYLQSRGLSKERAEAVIVNGFLESIIKELPIEYAVELNRLINLEMEGSVG